MKYLSVLLISIFTTTLVAQNSIEKEIGEFNELKVYDLINVELIESKHNKVVITGKNTENVLLNNKNGTLKIKMNLKEIFDGNETQVKLYYSKVDVIDVNEGATVTSEDNIKQFEIDLKAQEGGKINVKIDVTYANIKSVTGGIIVATGKAKSQDVSLLTGGVYKGAELKTDKTEVSIKAAGEAHVNAKELVDVNIRVGGDVYIYGDPEKVNESTALGGRVKRM
ncbi:head GIN domain-containing protein [Seonamhaeicola aphaedonensis]|uniref:Putative autotransporter adhesin-like protein n=1 Tax=Seonamhaeicola aphaedonensis TaxID=1461338 RepID=A0A3D9HHL6_9FLAO|nr:head GIN domain-containing protein [Seonamhaeicola aphaedonensis]RED48999.1 putative autotransporter adhesin-like protein [Seonamhaeicola aphaedonensis]